MPTTVRKCQWTVLVPHRVRELLTASKIPTHIVKVKLSYACGISNKPLNMVSTEVTFLQTIKTV